MTSENGQKRDKQYYVNLALAAVAGQVGCLTLIIIIAALFLGLWLDSRFDTRPVLTLVLVFGSLPVSLIMMFVVVRGATKRIKHGSFNQKEKSQDET